MATQLQLQRKLNLQDRLKTHQQDRLKILSTNHMENRFKKKGYQTYGIYKT